MIDPDYYGPRNYYAEVRPGVWTIVVDSIDYPILIDGFPADDLD